MGGAGIYAQLGGRLRTQDAPGGPSVDPMATVEVLAPPSGDALAAALGLSEAYPGRPDAVEVRETHISWVFLAGDRAYKLKKPVTLPFVDYGTPARRRAMCEEEVRLNRRLAPDVYLGILGVVATADGGVALAPADHPEAIDHVVEMRRFDEGRTLAALVSSGHVSRRARGGRRAARRVPRRYGRAGCRARDRRAARCARREHGHAAGARARS